MYIENTLKFLKNINDKKIIFFGTGQFCISLTDIFPLKIAYYLDNSKEKWNKEFSNSKIYNPNILKEEKKENIVIIVTSMYYESISKQLLTMGLKENIHFFDGIKVLGGLVFKDKIFVDESIKWSLKLKNNEFYDFVIKNRDEYINLINNFTELHNKKIITDSEYKDIILNNQELEILDAITLYGMIAYYKPNKFLQVGKGLIEEIVYKAKKDLNKKMNIEVIENIIMRDNEDLSASLESGDILFINNFNNILKNIDVVVLFLDFIARLKKGVIVQFNSSFISYQNLNIEEKVTVNYDEELVNFLLYKLKSYGYKVIMPSTILNEEECIKNIICEKNKELFGNSFWIEVSN